MVAAAERVLVGIATPPADRRQDLPRGPAEQLPVPFDSSFDIMSGGSRTVHPGTDHMVCASGQSRQARDALPLPKGRSMR